MSTELIISYDGEQRVVKVEEDEVVTFPEGLIGFADVRQFVLLDDPEVPPVTVLQCVEEPSISFLAMDPHLAFPDYNPQPLAHDLARLGLTSAKDARLLCILNALREPLQITANLLAPIVINPKTRLARQLILQESGYSVRHPVLMFQR